MKKVLFVLTLFTFGFFAYAGDGSSVGKGKFMDIEESINVIAKQITLLSGVKAFSGPSGDQLPDSNHPVIGVQAAAIQRFIKEGRVKVADPNSGEISFDQFVRLHESNLIVNSQLWESQMLNDPRGSLLLIVEALLNATNHEGDTSALAEECVQELLSSRAKIENQDLKLESFFDQETPDSLNEKNRNPTITDL